MLKPLVLAVIPLLLALAPAAAAAQEAKGSLLMGTWAVDTTRLPLPPGARPQSVTLRFASESPGRLRMTVDVVDASGATLHAEGVTPLDGTPTPVPANFEADMSATLQPQADVLVVQLAKGGMPASTRIYAVAADGKSLVETVAHFDADGKPVLRRNYFTRMP